MFFCVKILVDILISTADFSLGFFPNPDFCRFLKTSTLILTRVYF
ncbi:hypothetical protein [Moraxella lacunata]